MNVGKVCRGCFSEWDNETGECPGCGWNPDIQYPKVFDWKTGDVLEKRYLLGNIYYSSEKNNIAVWRIYDNLLGVSGFVLVKPEEDNEELVSLAHRLQGNNETVKNHIVVQAVKMLSGKSVLLFSMSDPYMDIVAFKTLLETETEKPEVIIPEPQYEEDKKQVLPLGTCIDNRYRIVDCLGIGGFGITYLCEDILLHRLVALKEYFPAEWAQRDETYVTVRQSKMLQAYRYGMQSFLKEIKITAKFIHTPHMVTIYDAMEANDTVYMVEQYIQGISIGREMRMRQYRPYDTLELAEIILPVLDALEAIHDKKIIHSDISPGNIMRTKQGDICLIDMGAAKYNLESQPPLSAAFLKIDYAAPEQYRTAKEGTPKGEGPWTDIYALGATMYYLLTGSKAMDVMNRLSGNDIEWSSSLIGSIPVEWIEFLQKTMALESSERIRSVAILREKMHEIL